MRLNIKKIVGLSFVGLLAFSAAIVPSASAKVETSWGPQDRATFTWAAPATYPTFNSITDNPFIGDERNFVRIKEYGTEDNYSDDVYLEDGKEYEIKVYYHNNASATFNQDGTGVASNVRLRMESPQTIEAGKIGVMTGFISSTNTTPEEIWDTAYMHASGKSTLTYIANSTVLHNSGTANGSILSSEAMFGSEGTKLAHSNSIWGAIPGCNEYAGYVTFRVSAKVEGENPTPTPTPTPTPDPTPMPVTPDEPTTPDELPSTGPLEITLAVIIVLLIGGGVFYLIKTRRDLKKVTKTVEGDEQTAQPEIKVPEQPMKDEKSEEPAIKDKKSEKEKK